MNVILLSGAGYIVVFVGILMLIWAAMGWLTSKKTHKDINPIRSFFVHPIKTPTLSLVLMAILFTVFMYGDTLIKPPELRQNNEAHQFDTLRALERIVRISGDQKPHPVDSAANERLRLKLVNEIRQLGFEPTVTRADSCFSRENFPVAKCTQVSNVAFRVGPEGEDVILATSHYDSVPAGPGAADAQMAVAVLLETAYLLSQQELKRPILFLITDGEEAGLFGARSFVEDDPRSQSVKTIVNFEARGVQGPVFMYETSQPNGRVIPALIDSAQRPFASSLMAAIYALLPNSTDVAVYLPYGYEALNFAIIGREAYYHTPYDNLQNLSLRSLQHMGDLGLSTLRAMTVDPVQGTNQRFIYTDILSRGMFAIPESAAIPLLGLAVLLGLWGLLRSNSELSQNLTPGHRIRVFLIPLLLLVLVALIGYGLQFLIDFIRVEDRYWGGHPWAVQAWASLISFMVITWMPRLMPYAHHRAQLFMSSWIWFCLIGLLTAIYIPGISILFVLPAIFFILAMLLALTHKTIRLTVELLAAIITSLVWVTIIVSIGDGLGYGQAYLISLLTTIALLPWLSLLSFVHENSGKRYQPQTKFRLILVAVGMLSFFSFSVFSPAYSIDAPRHLNIIGLVDPHQQAAYLTFGTGNNPPPQAMRNAGVIKQPAEVVSPFSGIAWHTEIKYPDLLPPTLEHINDQTDDLGQRSITMRVSTHGADKVIFYIPKQAGISQIQFDDKTLIINATEQANRFARFECQGRSCNGRTLIFSLTDHTPQEWFILGEHFRSLPEAEHFADARPYTVVPRQSGDRTYIIHREEI